MNMSLWTALINATGRPMMSENCHNRPSWWSPGPTSADVCDSNMWRSGGDIGNGFGGALSELHQGMRFEQINASNPWGAKPLSRKGCWAYVPCRVASSPSAALACPLRCACAVWRALAPRQPRPELPCTYGRDPRTNRTRHGELIAHGVAR